MAALVEDEEEGDVTPAGPAALLATGASHQVQKLLLHAHRALGALGTGTHKEGGAGGAAAAAAAAAASAAANSPEEDAVEEGDEEGGEGAGSSVTRGAQSAGDQVLTLVGGHAWSRWLDVPEYPMPANLGVVRCLASVNIQLFGLRRLCARLNGAAGGGSANIAAPLLAALRVGGHKGL
jgi:hypothetical protein